jgi:nucleotide-binding universal stress UspA family protein
MEKIVVGVDGSEQSKDALRFALEEGELRDATVVAVHAWTLPVAPVDETLVPTPVDYPALFQELQEAADGLLESVVEEVTGAEGTGVRVERVAVEGPPAAVLLDAAADAGLIVVGSSGHGGFAKLLLGSVSEHVARHAPCPVLIHRTPRRNETP